MKYYISLHCCLLCRPYLPRVLRGTHGPENCTPAAPVLGERVRCRMGPEGIGAPERRLRLTAVGPAFGARYVISRIETLIRTLGSASRSWQVASQLATWQIKEDCLLEIRWLGTARTQRSNYDVCQPKKKILSFPRSSAAPRISIFWPFALVWRQDLLGFSLRDTLCCWRSS